MKKKEKIRRTLRILMFPVLCIPPHLSNMARQNPYARYDVKWNCC
jgi:hypothetical protein